MTTQTQRFTPDPETIYLGDNGRALCGAHLGTAARFSGRDLSGQPILPLTRQEVVVAGMQPNRFGCERCGRTVR